jgi:hypothetical protein
MPPRILLPLLALLIPCGLAYLVLSTRPQPSFAGPGEARAVPEAVATKPSPGERSPGGAEPAASIPGHADPAPAAGSSAGARAADTGCTGCATCATAGAAVVADAAAHPPLPLADDFIARLAAEAPNALIPLPDGRVARVRVDHLEPDGAGAYRAVAGRIEEPGQGRFVFQLGDEHGVAGRMSGVIDLFGEPLGFRIEPGAGGRPELVARPTDAVVCRGLAPPPGAAEPATEEIPANHPTNIPIPSYQNGVVPLQSRPGATGVLYLDFDGETGPFPGWGEFDAARFNLTTAQIKEVWARVAEDFAPFNFNVTTDLAVFLAAPRTSSQRCIITPTTDAAPGAGGVAYVGSYNWNEDRPCWAFYGSGKSAAEVISHELGHTLGLSHDGRITPSEGYYGGHGTDPVGWAPIMGVGYYKNLSQWSKGEYLSANRTQDDIAIIANNNNNAGIRADDAGGTHASARPLEIFSNNSVSSEGVIETRTDVDAFRFQTTGGSVSLTVSPVGQGPNLDILAEIRDAAGNLVVESNPLNAINAGISTSLAAGEFTVRVSGSGRGDPLGDGYTDYGSLGAYVISGTVNGGVKPERFTVVENAVAGTVVGTVVPRLDHGGNPLAFAIVSGNNGGAFAINSASGQITVANPALLDFETLSAGWEFPALFDLQVSISDVAVPAGNESLRVVVTVSDVNEAPVVAGGSALIPTGLRAGSPLVTVAGSDPDRFQSLSYAITAGNTGNVFSIGADGVVRVASPPAAAGTFNLSVRATDSGSPAMSATTPVTVTVFAIPAGYEAGAVRRTFYDGISGSGVSNLTGNSKFPTRPDREIALGELADGIARGDNYGSTVRAFLVAPHTASYTFWIAGDDSCELRLGSGPDPAGATTRASFSGSTSFKQWTKYSGQQSAAINLSAGQVYYLEARHKEGGGADHLAVAWRAISGSTTLIPQQVIPLTYLAPHEMNYQPQVAAASAAIHEQAWAGATVATMAGSDLNTGQSLSWAITAGNASGAFAVEPSSGRVFVAAPGVLNAAAAPSFNLTLRATDNGSPVLSGSASLGITVRPAGFIAASGPVQEIWDNLSGTALTALTGNARWPNRPDRLRVLTGLDSGSGIADNYGARFRAYVIPPASGSYTFSLASDDNGALFLSTGENPANASQIASVGSWTGYLEWTKLSSQTSAPVNLVAGQRYFIEARVKEGGGGDHLSVGWTGPGITTVSIPAGAQVAPFDANAAPVFGASSYAFTVNRDLGAGAVAGTVAATSQPFERIVYSIVSGNPGGAFACDPLSGRITLAQPAAVYVGQAVGLTLGAQDDGYGGLFPPRSATVNVTVTVGGTNTPPVAQAQARATLQEQAVSVTLQASDPDGQPIAFAVLTPPAHGSLGGVAPNLTYTPAAGFHGADSFTFRASDGLANSPPATVTITVNGRPTAAPQTVLVTGFAPVPFTLAGSDPEGAPLAFAAGAPARGSVSGTAPALVFAPDDGPDGSVPLAFTVNDGAQNSTPATVEFLIRIPAEERWRKSNFPAAWQDPATAGPPADPDRDKLANQLEFAFALDPNGGAAPDDPRTPGGLPAISEENGVLRLTYRRNPAATGYDFIVEQAVDLAAPDPWSEALVTEQILSDDGGVQVIRASLPPGSPARFLRLRVREH